MKICASTYSSNIIIKVEPYRNRSIRLGERLFGTSAAKLWNELPRNIQRGYSITMFFKIALIGNKYKQNFKGPKTDP